MNIEFIFPARQFYFWLGLGVLVLALVVFVLRRLERSRSVRLTRFVDLQLAPRLLVGFDARLRKPLFWLPAAGCLFLVLTLAQPHWGEDWQEVSRRSHDILICLDISESMRAEDVRPNRLERAKQKIESILDRTKGDRFGLIAFSGTAVLMCPLTLDRGYFRSVLNAVDTDSISLKGTNIGMALGESIRVFRDQEEHSSDYAVDSRAVLLISDGEQVAGDAVALAAEVSEYARIFVIGVGNPQGAEITFTNKFGRRTTAMSAGQPHLSKLDEETLQLIAMEGRGGYIRSTPDNSDIEKIYNLTQQLATTGVSGDIRLQLVNRFQWPLALAIICFAAEGLWLVLMPWLGRWQWLQRRDGEEQNRYA